jgi:hypothetical protein
LFQGEFYDFNLFLALLCHFAWLTAYLAICWLLRFLLLLDDLLELFFIFRSSSYASWGLRFKLQILCFLLSMDSSKRRLRNQAVSSLV